MEDLQVTSCRGPPSFLVSKRSGDINEVKNDQREVTLVNSKDEMALQIS